MRIALQEIPFEDGPLQHSRFVSGIAQVNERNPDYKMLGSQEVKLAYATIMIGGVELHLGMFINSKLLL